MQRAAWLPFLLAIGCTPQHDAIIAQGTIEVEETDIVPTLRGRIRRIWVSEGSQVRAGDTLITLTSTTLPDDLREREARVAQAEAEVRDIERGSRPEEIARAEAELRSAIAEDARAAKEWERMKALAAGRLASVGPRIVNQRDVPSLKLGGTAEAIVDGARRQPISGRVVAINHQAEYTPRVALTDDERADLMFGVALLVIVSVKRFTKTME